MERPLTGVRVVDFGQFIAAPAAGAALADMGADVIKVEPPRGDSARQIGVYGQAMIRTYNGGKRSLAVDLRTAEGRAVAGRLVRDADIVLQNLRTGVMEAFGLGPADVRAINPGVVYGSVSGFGRHGPSRNRPGFDIAAQAESGLMSVTGEAGRDPQRVGVPVVDAAAGHVLAEAVLGAYIGRLRFGTGRDVEVSLLDVAIHLQGTTWGEYFLTGRVPERKGNGQPTVAPAADVVPTADGAIVLSAYTPAHFSKLCALVGRPELAVDPRFATNPDRVAHRAELLAELAPAFRELPSEKALELLVGNGIVAGAINTYEQVAAHPDVRASGTFVEVVDDGEPYTVVRSPWRSGEEPARTPAPRVGQHTREILAQLGYPAAEVGDLVRRGIVGTGED
ncbi:CaiB/BaiF CoA transferase family protein [Pseudonocardia cypriaca]|uniref:Crotonobetainyl-CoA:carnitine CoA-transferase CaiB-like acyl-CoA transferase n=1 Tax=Pseudonocardia cypriaca TaxID=882449 RepID=A0A543FSK7_9PSEU|nr:CoA transferase [Pseudonocardia cypriaca]TQM36781.1 crotonobetainyl-CoA:carnitine CoA-transferase CaiB-like acyl-CoA transferase [Pseudonocardia cypriaca]